MDLPIESERLPGEALVRKGLEDLSRGEETAEALLVSIGEPRLRLLEVPLPSGWTGILDADRRLYRLLAARYGREAHSKLNSLVRELVSFERALERRLMARRRAARR